MKDRQEARRRTNLISPHSTRLADGLDFISFNSGRPLHFVGGHPTLESFASASVWPPGNERRGLCLVGLPFFASASTERAFKESDPRDAEEEEGEKQRREEAEEGRRHEVPSPEDTRISKVIGVPSESERRGQEGESSGGREQTFSALESAIALDSQAAL